MSGRDSYEVVIGSVWYVWGDHQEVAEQRPGLLGNREVRLKNRTTPTRTKQPWVEAWRVAHYGTPSVLGGGA